VSATLSLVAVLFEACLLVTVRNARLSTVSYRIHSYGSPTVRRKEIIGGYSSPDS
jgi:hypothetical protein